jgi:hypothetical protein
VSSTENDQLSTVSESHPGVDSILELVIFEVYMRERYCYSLVGTFSKKKFKVKVNVQKGPLHIRAQTGN